MGYLDDILDRRTQLLQLRRDLANEILAARSVPGPRTTTGESLLSPSGLAQHRRELVDKVRAKYAPKLADLVEDVETRAKFLAGDAQRARPMPGSDAASQMALQRSWDQVRTRLDAGMPLRTVIDNADLDTLHAIREWAPSHLEAQAFHEHQRTGLHSTGSMIGITRTFQPPDLTWLTASATPSSPAARSRPRCAKASKARQPSLASGRTPRPCSSSSKVTPCPAARSSRGSRRTTPSRPRPASHPTKTVATHHPRRVGPADMRVRTTGLRPVAAAAESPARQGIAHAPASGVPDTCRNTGQIGA
jgi:hypothetical protein